MGAAAPPPICCPPPSAACCARSSARTSVPPLRASPSPSPSLAPHQGEEAVHHSARLFCDLLRGQAAPAIAPALGDLVGLAVAWLRRKTLFGLRLALLSFLAQAVLALGAEATLGRRATHRRSAASAAAVLRPPSLPLPDNRLAADEAARLPRRGRPELDGGDTQPAVPPMGGDEELAHSS